MTPWHLERPQLLNELEHQIPARFPGLRVDATAERVVVTGTFQVVDSGRTVDEFRILIELPDDFPTRLPQVRELGSRIPLHEDFHANVDGTLCVVLPDEYWFERDRCDLLDYLGGPLRSYFIGVLHFLDAGSWPFGEHRHGADGIREFYGAVFGSSTAVEAYLRVLAGGRPKPGNPCPCGSGRPIKKCHWLKLFALHRKVRPETAREALAHLLE